MKLLLDMNLSETWVDVLQAAGLQATHWSSVGSIHAMDFEIMQYASHHAFVILTRDLDFGAMLAKGVLFKPSVVQIRGHRVDPKTMSSLVIVELQRSERELKAGCLLTITEKKRRIRLLPFRI